VAGVREGGLGGGGATAVGPVRSGVGGGGTLTARPRPQVVLALLQDRVDLLVQVLDLGAVAPDRVLDEQLPRASCGVERFVEVHCYGGASIGDRGVGDS